MMNAIAAHKDGLKKSLENLSGETSCVRHGFVASLNPYIARLAANRSRISIRVNECKIRARGDIAATVEPAIAVI
jgi:hypothetical protein